MTDDEDAIRRLGRAREFLDAANRLGDAGHDNAVTSCACIAGAEAAALLRDDELTDDIDRLRQLQAKAEREPKMISVAERDEALRMADRLVRQAGFAKMVDASWPEIQAELFEDEDLTDDRDKQVGISIEERLERRPARRDRVDQYKAEMLAEQDDQPERDRR